MICPKCGYERVPKDDLWIQSSECPKCGIVYAKYWQSKQNVQEVRKEVPTKSSRRPFVLVGAVAVFLLVVVFFKSYANFKTNGDENTCRELLSKAHTQFGQGENDEALESARQCLSILHKSDGIEGRLLTDTLALLADIERKAGRYDEAAGHLAGLLSIQEQVLGTHNEETRRTFNMLIQVREEQRISEAKPLPSLPFQAPDYGQPTQAARSVKPASATQARKS